MTTEADHPRNCGLYLLYASGSRSAGIHSTHKVLDCLPSLTDYTAAISNNARIRITHPFLTFYGREYVLIDAYYKGASCGPCNNEALNIGSI